MPNKLHIISLVAALALLLSGCDGAERAMVQRVEAALISDQRPASDTALDTGRMPVAMAKLLGLREGMKVLDVTSGAGYNIDIFAAAVGPTGLVYAHNTALVLSFGGGRNRRAMTARLNNNRLPNVTIWYREFSNLGLEQEVDVAYIGFNLHDFHSNTGHDATVSILRRIGRAMKPDGLLAISDHRGAPNQDNKKLHRIEQELAERLVRDAGLEIIKISEILANPDDDYSANVFTTATRGKTDRFVILAKLKQT